MTGETMHFDLTSEQQAIADSAARFTEREYNWDTRMHAIRGEEGRDPAHWATFAELGWLGAGLSEEAGGFGGGAVENAAIALELGKALVNEPFAAHVACLTLLASSNNGAIAAWIEPVIMGQMRISVALQEPQARGDFDQISTRYDKDGDAYRLNGAKSLVEGALHAQQLLVPALGENGLAIFALDTAAKGLTRRPYRLLDNRHVCDFALEDVRALPQAMLASGAEAQEALSHAIDQSLVVLCAEALGTMESALWATRDYLLTRTQFRVPLASFQALQHRMADMLIELEMTRSLLFHALGAAEADAATRTAAASALKVQTGHAGLLIGKEAIQMHGGIGVTEELAISHYFRRLYVVSRLLGDEAVHLARFANKVDAK
jgi:alkylation response protein AidB-like acyl-CoA dehydrogenase